MARPIKNDLHLEPLPGGRWRLFGYFRGERIRKSGHDFTKLNAAKLTMEQQLAAATEAEAKRPKLRMTWLSDDELRDAEAAALQAKGRRLIECVVAAARVLPPIAGKLCIEALSEWLVVLKKRKRSARTEDKNKRRVKKFLDFARAKHLEDIRPQMCEDWVYRNKSSADFTRITDAAVLRAWLNFCVQRRWLLVSPFEIDTKDMSASARTVESARILTPEQAHALLAAAQHIGDGSMVAYTILATWCFMSPQEIFRTTRAKMKLDAATPVVEVDTVKRRTAKFRTVTVPANVLPVLRAAVEKWPAVREVEDKTTKEKIEAPFTVPFSRSTWDRVRAKAGLLTREKPTKRGRRGTHRDSVWQDSILRHTGISYFHQSLTAKAHRGKFNEKSVIAEICRQAGNTSATAFAHYLTLPSEGDAVRFYTTPSVHPHTPSVHPNTPSHPHT